jgi:inhibitor of KinA sporulation pathway (predicted exonuclease)
MEMQAELGLSFVGRLHSGIDDCRNILLVLQELASKGAKIAWNG